MLSIYKGHHCQHRSDDWPVMAEIISKHKPRTVVELGTDEGGFAGWLADLVKPWGGHVFTFDVEWKFNRSLVLDFTNLLPIREDVLSHCNPSVTAIVSNWPQAPILLYCDNGDKKREVEMYAQFLPVGSLLAVHDYNTEIMAEWVEPFVADLGFEKEGHEKMEALRNEWYTEPMTRFWLRREA